MSTKRFDPIERLELGSSMHGEMEEYEGGDYVRFEDFERLQKQVAELSKPSPAFVAMREALFAARTTEGDCPVCGSIMSHEYDCKLAVALYLAETEHPAK